MSDKRVDPSNKADLKRATEEIEATEKRFEPVGGKYGSPEDPTLVTDDIDRRFGVTGPGGVDGDSGGEALGEFGGAGPDINNNDSNSGRDGGGFSSSIGNIDPGDTGFMNKGGLATRKKKKK